MVIFIPDVNFALSFILALNDPFLWYLPTTSSIDMTGSFFAYFQLRKDRSKVRINPVCLYYNSVHSFYIPVSFSY